VGLTTINTGVSQAPTGDSSDSPHGLIPVLFAWTFVTKLEVNWWSYFETLLSFAGNALYTVNFHARMEASVDDRWVMQLHSSRQVITL
jgi:hypothetical protein